MELTDEFIAESTKQSVKCHCKKNRCLTKYCNCFTIGRICGDACICNGCKNTSYESKERIEVIQKRHEAIHGYYSRDVPPPRHIPKSFGRPANCTCKQSKCIKKYCECYQYGRKCGLDCMCMNCENGGPLNVPSVDSRSLYSSEGSNNTINSDDSSRSQINDISYMLQDDTTEPFPVYDTNYFLTLLPTGSPSDDKLQEFNVLSEYQDFDFILTS